MGSVRNITRLLVGFMVVGWAITAFVLASSWEHYRGRDLCAALGMPDSPVALAALAWFLPGIFILMIPISPGYDAICRSVRRMVDGMRDAVFVETDDVYNVYDDDDDDDDLGRREMHADLEDEPMEPGHWLGARLVALAAIAMTFVLCEAIASPQSARRVAAPGVVHSPAVDPVATPDR